MARFSLSRSAIRRETMWSVDIEFDGSIRPTTRSGEASAKHDRYNNRYSRPETAKPPISERPVNYFRIYWCG